MPPRKRRRTTCAPRRGSATAASPPPEPDTPPALPARLLAEVAARTDVVTIFRCAATCKLFRREILSPSFTARVVSQGVVPGSSLLGLLDKTFSLVHPSVTTSNAASSFGELENSLAAFVSRSAGGEGFLLDRYDAVTSRGGLVLLKRREINRRRRSERRSDMCVYDPMTNGRAFFPFPPDINRNPFLGCVYTYVVLTAAADGIGCAFTVVAVDMAGLLDCSRDIRVQTVSSSDAGGQVQWAPAKLVRIHGAPPWSTPVDVHNAAVVVGGVIHWLMHVFEHILTYDVKTGRAGVIELPQDRRQFDNWNASDPKLRLSSDGKLTLLFRSEFRVYVWEQRRPGRDGWARQPTIDTEAGVRSQLEGEVESVTSGNLRFMNFGDQRSGAVLLEYYHFFKVGNKYHSELLPLVLDMETKEIRRIKAAGITYEVDLASRLSAMKAFSSTPSPSSSFVPLE